MWKKKRFANFWFLLSKRIICDKTRILSLKRFNAVPSSAVKNWELGIVWMKNIKHRLDKMEENKFLLLWRKSVLERLLLLEQIEQFLKKCMIVSRCFFDKQLRNFYITSKAALLSGFNVKGIPSYSTWNLTKVSVRSLVRKTKTNCTQ